MDKDRRAVVEVGRRGGSVEGRKRGRVRREGMIEEERRAGRWERGKNLGKKQ